MRQIKFLADVNVKKPLVDYLLGQGYDINWAADYDSGSFNAIKFAYSRKNNLVTIIPRYSPLITTPLEEIPATIMKQSRVFNPPKWVLGGYSDRLLVISTR